MSRFRRRHLDMLFSHIKYGDKAFMGSVTSGPNAADSVAMAEIVFGADVIRADPALLSLINVSSPRRYDERMLAAVKVYARARQALIITPFILAGAMGPTTIAGTVAQLNAEAWPASRYPSRGTPTRLPPPSTATWSGSAARRCGGLSRGLTPVSSDSSPGSLGLMLKAAAAGRPRPLRPARG